MVDKDLKLAWEWIDRPLDNTFWENAGKLTQSHNQLRFDKIPEELKPLAFTMINLAQKNCVNGLGGKTDHACLVFRCMLYSVYRRMLEKGIDIKLPHGWFCDGPMIEPEWIVRITNGIIGWTCDNSKDSHISGGCGLDECRFRE